MSFLEQLKAKYLLADDIEKGFLRTYTEISASSLSRIWQHVENKDTAFGIITAFKSGRGRAENVQKTLQLAQEIKQAGFGFFWLKGYWSPTGESVPDSQAEDSIFVIADKGRGAQLKSLLTELIRKYEQFAFAWKGEGDKTLYGVNSDGSTERYGDYHPDRVAKAYSKLMQGEQAGRTFTFASVWEANNHQMNSYIDAYITRLGL